MELSINSSERGVLPPEDLLLQTIHDVLDTAPGKLLFMDVIPEWVTANADCYATETGFLLFMLKDAPGVEPMKECKSLALLAATYENGPVIFMTWN